MQSRGKKNIAASTNNQHVDMAKGLENVLCGYPLHENEDRCVGELLFLYLPLF
jgi:hypothetical protein